MDRTALGDREVNFLQQITDQLKVLNPTEKDCNIGDLENAIHQLRSGLRLKRPCSIIDKICAVGNYLARYQRKVPGDCKEQQLRELYYKARVLIRAVKRDALTQ